MYKEMWQLYTKGYGRLRMATLVCGLAIGVSLLEGLNIGLLVPLLEQLQSPEAGGGHWISRGIGDVFDAMGVPFSLKTILLSLGLVILGIAVLKYLRLVLAWKLRHGFTTWIRSEYMWGLLNADLAYYHSETLGVMTDTLTTQSAHAGATIADAIELVASCALVLTYLVVAFLISPVLTAGALVALLIVFIGVQHFITAAKKGAETRVARDYTLQVAGVENLSGIQVIKSFLLERVRWSDYSRKCRELFEANYFLGANHTRLAVFQEVFLFAIIGAIVFVGVSEFGLGIAVIIALLFVLYRMMPKVTGLNGQRQVFAESLAGLHAVYVAMEKPSSPTIISGNRPFVSLTTGIELNDVGFSYNGGADVLAGTSFTIPAGEMTAIVGASGAGKTTLVDLLLRFYDPDRGSVLVDGVDLRELELASWRRSIGVVGQDVFLFNDTVANNIALGRQGVTEVGITDAAKRAYAHDFIENLPQGYETHIGDRGWNLSGGQRQRVALARAIVESPEMLILDEATSSLDSESEKLIQDYMRKIRGTCTLIVVAHRTATIRDADNIVVLENGKIAEQGDWDALIEEAGIFANYHHLQRGRS